jgi:plasmid stabilization system protein ParE
MSYTVLFLAKTRKELAASWSWYEDRKTGLEDRFINIVMDKVLQIGKTPDHYPKRIKNYHEAIVPVFPYLIIYRVNKKKKVVAIVSVFHIRRSPVKNLEGNDVDGFIFLT